MRFGITGAKTRAWYEIRPLGCRESAGSNLARSDEPLLSLPNQAGSANRHVDQIHLSLFTADCVPVQRASMNPVISPCRSARNDYEYFTTPCLAFPTKAVVFIMRHCRPHGGVTGFLSVIPCAKWKRLLTGHH